MKNEKQRFVPLKKRFDEWVRAMPKSERAKSKRHLKTLNVVVKNASAILFWAKFAEAADDSRFHAKWVSHDLKGYKHIIRRAAERQDKRFFIDLGKILSEELDSTIYDKIDEYIAVILAFYPPITAKGGVRVLDALGFRITEENFRERKYRLLRTAAKFGLHITKRKERLKRNARAAEEAVVKALSLFLVEMMKFQVQEHNKFPSLSVTD